MPVLFYFLLFTLFLILFLTLITFVLAEVTDLNREEHTTYECGFEPHGLSRVSFSIRYFFLTLIFLLFDLEVILLIFLPDLFFNLSGSIFSLAIIFLFFMILLLGLYYEWSDGSLEWVS